MNDLKQPRAKGNVLVFTYRLLSQFLHEVSDRCFEGQATFCAEWPGIESNFLQADFYRHFRAERVAAGLSSEDLEQIVRRCSVLKLLPRPQAEQMVHAMYHVIEELVDRAA